ncbi:MAG: trypsin-like peptidase domain-containing protein [Candidatus Nanoarchaeia archaeon]
MKTVRSICTAVALAAATIGGGYVGSSVYTQNYEEAQALSRRQQLNNILGATQEVVVFGNYHIEEIHPATGPREFYKEIRSGGSAVAVHRDEEGRVYFLTSHHVVQNEKDFVQTRMIQVAPFIVVPATRKHTLLEEKFGIKEYETEDDIGMETLELLAVSEPTLPTDFESSMNYQDLALLRTKDPTPYSFWKGPWAEKLYTGDDLVSAGYTKEWDKHLIDGILRSVNDPTIPDTIHPTTLPIMRGYSGGGVYRRNSSGDYEFAGLNVAIMGHPNMGGITPVHHIRQFLKSAGYEHIIRGDSRE